MTLYLYKVGTTIPSLTIENVTGYTDSQVTALTEEGETIVYEPLAEGYELSYTEDCNGTLRTDWRKLQGPSTEERISVLEEQLVQADETAIALYESQQEQETINAQQDEALMEIYEMLG